MIGMSPSTGGVQSKGNKIALSTAPAKIHGRRLPQRLRVLSDILPINGSVSASNKRGTIKAMPTHTGSMPSSIL